MSQTKKNEKKVGNFLLFVSKHSKIPFEMQTMMCMTDLPRMEENVLSIDLIQHRSTFSLFAFDIVVLAIRYSSRPVHIICHTASFRSLSLIIAMNELLHIQLNVHPTIQFLISFFVYPCERHHIVQNLM